jgi:hypothetical protein
MHIAPSGATNLTHPTELVPFKVKASGFSNQPIGHPVSGLCMVQIAQSALQNSIALAETLPRRIPLKTENVHTNISIRSDAQNKYLIGEALLPLGAHLKGQKAQKA